MCTVLYFRMFRLRPYQEKIISETRAFFNQGIKEVLITSPTGSGKTLLTAQMLKTSADRGYKSLFIVHRRELIKQSSEAFDSIGLPHGIIANGWPESQRMVIQIASIQTLSRRLDKIGKTDFIVFDECHHTPAKNWRKVYEKFNSSYVIGLSATPCRLDGKGLGIFFKKMVTGPSVRWLIDNGFLSDYKIYAPSTVITKGLHTRMGDYIKEELQAQLDKPSITGCAIQHYKRLAMGKRAVVFAVSIEHSKHIVEQFRKEGINAEHIDGETPIEERDCKLKSFRNGDIQVISNVELFGEGFDLPALECAILLRPTASNGLYLQQVGRSLRPHTNKSAAIILDHAGNCSRFGLPCEERQWSLENGLEKTKKENLVKVRVCKKCFAALQANSKSCSYCGYFFETEGRQVVEKDGELVEINRDTVTAKSDWFNEQHQAKDFNSLVELGKRRGYKRPFLWAKYVFNARQSKKLSGV